MRKTVLAIIMIMTMFSARVPGMCAQEAPYKFDIGVGLGMSGYLGDVNGSNPFKHPGLAGSAQFRYIANSRWALRGQLGVQGLSGNSGDMEGVFPDGASYEFTSTVFDLGARAEFNFFPYGMGETYKQLRRWSPFVAVGAGVSLASTGGDGTFVGFNVPLTVGVKYKFRERINLGVEFTMTKVFSDNVDGNLADLFQIKSDFLKNTDWYSTLSLSLTYEFGKRCETCHRID